MKGETYIYVADTLSGTADDAGIFKASDFMSAEIASASTVELRFKAGDLYGMGKGGSIFFAPGRPYFDVGREPLNSKNPDESENKPHAKPYWYYLGNAGSSIFGNDQTTSTGTIQFGPQRNNNFDGTYMSIFHNNTSEGYNLSNTLTVFNRQSKLLNIPYNNNVDPIYKLIT